MRYPNFSPRGRPASNSTARLYALPRQRREHLETTQAEHVFQRTVVVALLVSLGYYVTAKIGFAFALQPGSVSTLWMPNSILLAGLLLVPKRLWWLILLPACVAHFASELQSGVPMTMVFSWFVSNSAQALIAAFLVSRFVDGMPRFDVYHDLMIFVVLGALVAPFLASFMDIALVKLNGWSNGAYWDLWRIRFCSNVLATLVLVPVIITWATAGLPSVRKSNLAHFAEAGALAVSLLIVSIIVFSERHASGVVTPWLLYIPLPFLLWAAVRFGPQGASTSLLLVMFLAISGAVHGAGPFVANSSAENALSIQGFLIVVLVPLMTLAAVIQERERAVVAARNNEDRLIESNRESRALAASLITAQESERRRIALLLHDDISQTIVTLGLAISRLKRKPSASSELMRSELDQLGQQANNLTTQIRRLSHQLHPEVLEHVGLVAALESEIVEFGRNEQIKVEFNADVQSEQIPLDISTCLYRVAIEALRNVSKHSGARSTRVALAEYDDAFTLEVSDSGQGFDYESARRGSGLGLIGAEERVKLLQGSFQIRSKAEGGTVLTARIPIAQ
ncbi:MAG TPA: MASE1 domain-containing protein [Pyrinomonadaceae bacterium]|nr:MASE1 domain-containing protein [Pyrinomonadaceae bacterium]